MTKFKLGLFGWAVVLSLAARVRAQHGPYQYCCDIQKCQNVTAACSQVPSCAASCLGANTTSFPTTCTPVWSLPGQDYACFAQYLSSNTSLIDQVCRQTYSPGLRPAPNAYISFGECRTSCGGWDLATSTTSTGPVAMLMQYIVPVVVFCFTIPRRRKWDVPDWMFEFGRRRLLLRLPRLVLSLLLSGLIVTVDITIWIFTTFIAAGPILVGGIMELKLDFDILRHMEDSETGHNCPRKKECLTPNERVGLMVAVLCGNLDDDIGDPRRRIGELLNVGDAKASPERLRSTQAYLASMLRSQGTFGSMVGAPVLFFVGSFIVAIQGLSDQIGNNSTAHSLAFGMWWMVIVQVTIVSSCILGSNNPSTVSGIVGDYEKVEEREHPRALGRLKHLGMTPMYESVFMPVTLWDRGRMKKRWLQRTAAWEARCWLRSRLEIRPFTGLFLIPLSAFLLVLIPSALAFLVSYTTPKICVSCRSMTFLVYLASQAVLIAANTWRTYYSDLEPASSTPLPAARRFLANAGTAIIVLFIALAVSGSFFTAFVGTILELLGVYANCICSIPASMWLASTRNMVQINFATDTLLHRQMSVYWSASGYAAIGFVMTMTYLGWWYQRALRRRFEGEIGRLDVK